MVRRQSRAEERELRALEIADELFVSGNTVKTHMRRVYRKLNASSRREAVLIATELGLIDLDAAPHG